jgi:hypothetical protein
MTTPQSGQYHNIPIQKGSAVDRYLTMVKETHMLPTWGETIAYIISQLDPDWDLIRDGEPSIEEGLKLL